MSETAESETPEERRNRWRHLPEPIRLQDTVTEVPDKAVPDSITYARDYETEKVIQQGLGAGA